MHLLKHTKQIWNASGVNKANFDFIFSCKKSECSHIHITIIQSTHYCPALSPLFVQVNIFHWLLWIWTSKNSTTYFKEVGIHFLLLPALKFSRCNTFLFHHRDLMLVLLNTFQPHKLPHDGLRLLFVNH